MDWIELHPSKEASLMSATDAPKNTYVILSQPAKDLVPIVLTLSPIRSEVI